LTVTEFSFRRSVLTVLGGAALAQAIPVAISPLLTRLYSPAEFGAWAFYLGALAILAVLATARLEYAIVLPRRDSEAAALTSGIVVLAMIFSASCFVVSVLLGTFVPGYQTSSGLGRYAHVLPLSLILTAVLQAGFYWLNRCAQYGHVAVSRVSLSAVTGGAQVLGGAVGAGVGGLVLGAIAGQLAACATVRVALRDAWRGIEGAPKHAMRAALHEQRTFAAYMVPGQLANIASAQVPIAFIGIAFGPAAAGFYALAERALFAPMSIVGNSVGDVYRQHAAAAVARDGTCRALLLRTAARLAGFAIVPVAVLLAWGPDLFGLIFGAAWRESGEIARVLAVTLLFQTISSPLSHTVLITGHPRWDLVWQIARFVGAILVLLGATVVGESLRMTVGYYAAFMIAMYISHSIMQLLASRSHASAIGRSESR
jgi:O-antigen/teichoic acid export membrane protein